MKICVLQPDYRDSDIDYGNYDPRRNLATLWPDAQVDHLFLKKISTYSQLKKAAKEGYDVFVNLCEGYLEWDIPSIDVIHSLELLNLPYTGPTPELYDPPKELMKYVAYSAGVDTPGYRILRSVNHVPEALASLKFPMFVKPAKAGDSLGIDENSRVHDAEALTRRVATIVEEFGEALVEEFIDGREFTVLVAADPDNPALCRSFLPVEYRFADANNFKTYAIKTSDLHPQRNVPCDDPELARRLKYASEKIFVNFGGKGYARMDYRVDATGNIFFLEVNFSCSVFYTDGYEGSADFILKYDGVGQAGFLRHIVAEGIARHRRKQPLYFLRGNALDGYGICARRAIAAGEVVFNGEGRAQRMVTRRHAVRDSSPFDPLMFRRYAYPVSEEVFLVWDETPASWAPQNHSCEPNCAFYGLDVVTLRKVAQNEELTLDYAAFLDDSMEPFLCRCGAPSCRGLIKGTRGNSVTTREKVLSEYAQPESTSSGAYIASPSF